MRRVLSCASALIALLALPANALDLTLSDQGILALTTLDNFQGAQILSIFDNPGLGVEYTFRLPGTTFPSNGLQLYHKFGAMDVTGYENFALHFEVLDVTGVPVPPVNSSFLQLAAVVYRPVTGWFFTVRGVNVNQQVPEVTSRTNLAFGEGMAGGFGFAIAMPPPPFAAWTAPATFTVRISPATHAVMLPEPGALALVLLGGAMLRRRRAL